MPQTTGLSFERPFIDHGRLTIQDRNARIIARLHERAVAPANNAEARRSAINAAIAETVRRRRTKAILPATVVFTWGLVCAAALAGMVASAI
jgi:hypothetical protein